MYWKVANLNILDWVWVLPGICYPLLVMWISANHSLYVTVSLKWMRHHCVSICLQLP